jgi:hypothetical protein
VAFGVADVSISPKSWAVGALVVAGAGLVYWLLHPVPTVTVSAVPGATTELVASPAVEAEPEPPTAAATSLATAPVVAPTVAAPASDRILMEQLRAASAEPARAERLARQGLAQFPSSVDNAERHKLLIDAIAAQKRLGEARGEAEVMVNRYTGTPWAREVERLTGAHPRVNRTYVTLPSR